MVPNKCLPSATGHQSPYGRTVNEESEDLVRAHAWVSGRVQGVAYRAFARQEAGRLGLTGGTRNLDDGRVEVEAEGPRHDVETFLSLLRKGPPLARVTEVQVQWKSPTRRDVDFTIWY